MATALYGQSVCLLLIYARHIPNRTRRDGSALLSRISEAGEAEKAEPGGSAAPPKYSR